MSARRSVKAPAESDAVLDERGFTVSKRAREARLIVAVRLETRAAEDLKEAAFVYDQMGQADQAERVRNARRLLVPGDSR
jgi:hypothetical protein